jgi:tetratricopeptide (TPR) repeat protein
LIHAKYKVAKDQLKENNFSAALARMIPLKKDLHNSPFYQQDIGLICLKAKQTKAAYDAFLIASNYLSDPMLYILLGRCCIDLNSLDKAENYFKTARNIQPSLLSPYYELSRLYLLKQDTSSAIVYAQYVVGNRTKVRSKNISFFEAECLKTINSLNSHHLLKTYVP